MNNAVRSAEGRLIGFRCFQCNRVVQQMWDTTCNRCREENRKHKELIEAIKSRPLSDPTVIEKGRKK
jgi:hypothetical protein